MYTKKKQFTRKGGKWSGKYFRGFKCARLLKERMFDVNNAKAKEKYEEKCKDVPSLIHSFKTDEEIKEILEKKKVGKLNEKTITVAKTVPIFVTEEDARAIEKRREARRKESAERKTKESVERKTKSKSASPRTKTAKLAAEAAEKSKEEARLTKANQAALAEQARLAEAALAEQARLAEAEQARILAEAAEQSRLAEAARLAAETAEQARLAAETADEARLAEQARLAAETAEQARLAAETAEQARLAAETAEQARLAAETAEQARLADEARLAVEAETARLASQLLSPVVYTKGNVRINIRFVDETLKQQFEKELQMESELKTNKDQFIQNYPEFTDLVHELQNIHGDTPFSTSCVDNCKRLFNEFWRQESQSTVFMLRLLCNSCIYHTHETPIEIQVLNSMSLFKSNLITITFPQQQQYTIFGLGPSGCGKSTISIPIFGLFPDIQSIVSLDGGIIRETSFAWNISAKFNGSQGLKNLNDLFNKINVKSILFHYLKLTTNFSLYVPETVSNIKSSVTTTSYINKFVIQNSTLIVILIWQHQNCQEVSCENKKECPFPQNYRCKGCDVSAISRSASEGKVYTGHMVYDLSMMNAYFGLRMKSVAHKFMIHNSGSANTSIILSNFANIKPEYDVNGIKIKFLSMFTTFEDLKSYRTAAEFMMENVPKPIVKPTPRPLDKGPRPAPPRTQFTPRTPISQRASTPRSNIAFPTFNSSPSAFSNLPTSALTEPTGELGGTRRKVSRKNKSRRRFPSK
jgi:hypothetical protein